MSNANKLIQSLVGYVKDVKPFHSKLREFTSELFFEDEINAAVVDTQPELQVGLRNVWGRLDDERLARLSEGSAADQIINIPPMVLSRFSLNTFLNYGQRPLGNDPASPDLTNQNTDGKPDAEVPYILPIDPDGLNHLSQSHQLGSDAIPIEVIVDEPEFEIDAASLVGSTMTFSGTGYVIVSTSSVVELLNFGADLGEIYVRLSWKDGHYMIAPGTLDVITTDDGTFNIFRFPVDSSFNALTFPLPDGTVPGVTDEQWSLAIAHMAEITCEVRGDTGRYKVPFHHGSYVEVDNAPQTLLTDYTVDRRRSVIQFLDGKHPTSDQRLAFNLYTSDRMFVAMASPYDYDISRAYAAEPYDALPYDDNGSSSTESDNFIIVVDDAYVTNHQPVIFNDAQPGRSKCILGNLKIIGSAAQGDVWLLTAVSDYVLKVQKISPTNSEPTFAYLNQAFDNGELSFTMTAPWVAYYFDLQTGSYLAAIDVPNGDYLTYNWLYDQADFFPDVNVVTEHGVVSDPVPPKHDPVLYNTIGHVKQRLDGTYYLQLLSIPPRGTYIEVRVEQSLQYNPRANTGMDERVDIVVITDEDIEPHGFDMTPFDTTTYDDSPAWDGSGSQSIVTMITTFGAAPAPAPAPPPPPPIADVGDFPAPEGERIVGWLHPANAFNVPYIIYDPIGSFLLHPGPNAERPLLHWDNVIGPGTYTFTVTCMPDGQPDGNWYDIVHNGAVIETVLQGQTKSVTLELDWFDFLEFPLAGPSYAGGGDYLDLVVTDGTTTWNAYDDFFTYLGEQNDMWKYFYRSDIGYPNGATNSAGPMLPQTEII
jgi:hypothetical protein